MTAGQPIEVIKLDPDRHETWRYSGTVIFANDDRVVLEAFFNRPDLPFHGMLLANHDRFLEAYFCSRWYNIFEIHDHQTDQLKGWYCNVTLPAEIGEKTIAYVDLALDLLVFPDGRQFVLDEDEFNLLALDDARNKQARRALLELQALAHEGKLAGFLKG